MFLNSTSIKYCFYNDTENILGNTFDLCIFQDFSALSPNVLARAAETTSGGGSIIFIVDQASKIKDIQNIILVIFELLRLLIRHLFFLNLKRLLVCLYSGGIF